MAVVRGKSREWNHSPSTGRAKEVTVWLATRFARVIETQFSRDSSDIIQVHLRIELLRGVRTNRLPTFRTGAAIEGDPKLRRALDDVVELPERQPEQEQNDGDGPELMRFSLLELVVEADAKTGQRNRQQQQQW